MLPKLSRFTSLPCLQALRVRRRWCTFHLEMIFRDHKLDKHGNNCSFKTRISNYRETGRNTSSPLSEGHTVWKIEEYLLWSSQVEDKVANPEEYTNQKIAKDKTWHTQKYSTCPNKISERETGRWVGNNPLPGQIQLPKTVLAQRYLLY